MTIEIDDQSGFCYGVIRAIRTAEKALDNEQPLLSLGEIVHNDTEMERLKQKGLQVITHAHLPQIQHRKLLIRAHGEPPATYQIARQQQLTLIDCTCPVVLKLQQRIKKCYEQVKAQNGQLLIFGQRGHAEVNGLIGQVNGNALVIENESQLNAVDYTIPIWLFAQTTMRPDAFHRLTAAMKARMLPGVKLTAHNTICSQVAGRQPHLKKFAAQHDLLIFVSGRKSSNGKVLFEACKAANPHSHLIEDVHQLQPNWFKAPTSIGICGATSTPKWLMEQVAEAIKTIVDCSTAITP